MSGPADSSAAPLRLILVGLGKIAHDQHLPTIAAHPGFTLVGAASPEGAADGVPVFRDLEALFESGLAFDAAALCTPPAVRRPLARALLERGKHVLLEKPPAATLGELADLEAAAHAAGATLMASWHSRHAPAVARASAWLANRILKAVRITWKEDVHVWHPGQAWIWEAGGLGVFDPGVNALSIVTALLPRPIYLQASTLWFPENQSAPVAAELKFQDDRDLPVTATFDFLQRGDQTWDVEIDTEDGRLRLSQGGARLWIDDLLIFEGPEAEYRSLYDRFASLVAQRSCDVDPIPLQHVADALLRGRRISAPPLHP